MPIGFGSKLSSSEANTTFMDRTTDTDTTGKLALNNTDPLSGSSISNIQREINKATKIIFPEASIGAAGTLSPNSLSLEQEFRLVGDGAAVTFDLQPFGAVQSVEDGTRIMLVGHDDTNTVTVPFNDAQYGCYLNGDATLKRGYILELVYNNELERYLEVSRNF